MAFLQLNQIVKQFGKTQTIHGIDLSIEEGEFVVFVGPSGCGKSTLLRMIAGLESITSGELVLEGKVVNALSPMEREVAMVFQTYALYPHMTVKQNMAFSLKMAKTSKEIINQRVANAAAILKLDQLLDRLPKNLSGGQRQRVAIGRAIVRQPKLFLFDEPLSNLDAELRVEMRVEIAKLHEQIGNTMIYVTHDQTEAMTMADKIVVLNAGRVEQVGKPMALYRNPKNQFVAGFIGSPKMNFIQLKIISSDAQSTTFALPNGQQFSYPISNQHPTIAKQKVINLGIRPEHLNVGSVNEAAPVVQTVFAQTSFDQTPSEQTLPLNLSVDYVEALGGSTFIYATLIDSSNTNTPKTSIQSSDSVSDKLIIVTHGEQDIDKHTNMQATVAYDHLYLFDAETGENILYDPSKL